MIPRYNNLKSEVDCIWGRKDVLGDRKILWSRIIFIVNRNKLTMECINVVFGDSYTAISRRKDRQGSLLILLIFVSVYSIFWQQKIRLWFVHGYKWWPSLSPFICTIKKMFFRSLLYEPHHPLCGINLLVEKFKVRHDLRTSLRNSLHNKMVLILHQNQNHPLQTLLMTFVWTIIPDDGVVMEHTGKHRLFWPCTITEDCSPWHYILFCCLSRFSRLLRTTKWLSPVGHIFLGSLI